MCDPPHRYNDQCFKQESLLYVSAHLLLNLAEDTRVQVKMKNKGILQVRGGRCC